MDIRLEWAVLMGYELFSGFDDESDVMKQFNVVQINGHVLAALDAENAGSYEGRAFVLIVRDGKLYEINGSHCSCYGFEDQWSEEPTFIEALRCRDWGGDYSPAQVSALHALLDRIAQIQEV